MNVGVVNIMHSCHNCGRPLPAHLVSHASAWFALPKALRGAIWLHYRVGQEKDKRPSKEYVEALEACIAWWKEHGTICRVAKTTASRERIHKIGERVTNRAT